MGIHKPDPMFAPGVPEFLLSSTLQLSVHRRWVRCWRVLIIVGCMVSASFEASASPPDSCQGVGALELARSERAPLALAEAGLDVILMVDQSASMAMARGRSGSDSDGSRFTLIAAAASMLNDSTEPQRLRHRIALLSFGAQIQRETDWHVAGSSTGVELSKTLRAMSATSIKGATDFAEALCTAVAELARLPKQALRRRAVLLFTDGVPYPQDIRNNEFAVRMKTLVEEQLLRKETQLDVILLGNQADSTETVASFWRQAGASGVYVSRGSEPRMFAVHRSMARLLGTPLLRSRAADESKMGHEIVLPPYLEQVVFDVFGIGSATSFEIESPLGSVECLAESGSDCRQGHIGASIRTFTVDRPFPGRWAVRSEADGAQLEVVARSFYPRGELVSPRAVRQAMEVGSIVYRLSDYEGRALQELPIYPLHLDLALVAPTGERRFAELTRDWEAGPGIYRSRLSALPGPPGAYRAQIAAQARDLEGRLVTVFEDRWSSFELLAAPTFVRCMLTQEDAVGFRPGLGTSKVGRSISCTLRCTDRVGEAVDLEALTAKPASALFRAVSFDAASFDTTKERPWLELRRAGFGYWRGWIHLPSEGHSHDLNLLVAEEMLPAGLTLEIYPSQLAIANSSLRTRSSGWLFVCGAALLLLMAAWAVRYRIACAALHSYQGRRSTRVGDDRE